MHLYRLLDFVKSRTGQLSIFGTFLVGGFLFIAKYHWDQEPPEEVVSKKLKRLSPETLWSDEAEPKAKAASRDDEEFTFIEKRPGYRVFRTTRQVQVNAEPIVEPEPKVEPALSVQPVFPLPALIQFERVSKTTPVTAPLPFAEPAEAKVSPPKLNLEEGSVLYCQLATPVVSDQAGVPVLAKLTRSFVRGGKVLLPHGTSLSGTFQSMNGTRLFFAPDWRVQLKTGEWVNLKGHLQEAAFNRVTKRYTSNDGRSGLPSLITPKPKKKKDQAWKKALGTIASAAGRIAQDRVRTAVGEYIPASGRNVLLEGTSSVIDRYVEGKKGIGVTAKPPQIVEAGRAFYLLVSGQ